MIDVDKSAATLRHAAARDERNRWLGIALGAIAATSLAIAVISTRWLVVAYLVDGPHIGLREMVECTPGVGCTTVSNATVVAQASAGGDLGSAVGAFAPAGWIATIACGLAALALALSTTLVLARRRPEWPISPSTLAFLGVAFGIISGCVFIATKPAIEGALSLGWAFPVFCGGSVTGLCASILLARALRPFDPDLTADAMNPDDF